MTEKQFLKNFKKHCEIARDLGITDKNEIIKVINEMGCPFRCKICGCLGDVYPPRDCPCLKLKKLNSFKENAEEDWGKYSIKMLSILKSIPWRKP